MKRMGWLFCAVLSWAASSQAGVPSQIRAYQNDGLGLTVFKDTQDPNLYWYLPMLKLYTENGQVAYRKRALKDGNTEYSFFIVPYFSDDLKDFVAQELGTIDTRDQMLPVQAKKFAIQIKEYNVLAKSDDIDPNITNYQYLNKPQMVRLKLTDEQAQDFEELYNGAPGLPVNVVIYYEGERLKDYVTIELTYKEVFDALNAGGSARYLFAKAEIETAVTNYVSNKYLRIVSKGDIKMNDIVNKVIQECFTPVTRPTAGGSSTPVKPKLGHVGGNGLVGNYDGVDPDLSPMVMAKGQTVAAQFAALREEEANTLPARVNLGPSKLGSDDASATNDPKPDDGKKAKGKAPVDDSADDSDERDAPSKKLDKKAPADDASDDNGGGNSKGELQFRFKKENVNRTDTFYYEQHTMADSVEVVAMPTYLTKYAVGQASRAVQKLNTYSGYVSYKATKSDPADAPFEIKPGDQWTLSAVFQLSAESGCQSGHDVHYFRWDESWPKPDGDFYYRVGNGAWKPINGRTVLKSTTVASGRVQFYVDTQAIWTKLPSSWRTNSWYEDLLGVCNIFPYRTFYPMFNLVITGRHVDLNP